MPTVTDPAHIVPLNRLVAEWRVRPLRPGATVIPWFDPHDGGVHARVLLLLERPAPSTAARGPDALCSEDNPDRTNQLLKRLRMQAGLERADVVKWNAIPWAAGLEPTPLTRSAELAAAAPPYAAVVTLLRQTRVVITFGALARDVHLASLTADAWHQLPVTIAVPHPSPRNARGTREAQRRIVYALGAARELTG